MRHKDLELMQLIQEYVEQFHSDNRWSPSVGETASVMGKSKRLIHSYFVEMNAKGAINYTAGSITTDKRKKIKDNGR